MNTVKLNLTGLQTLQRQLGELTSMEAQVGLFESTAGRSADKNRIAHNPSLGFVHEFGNVEYHIPERSFLRMPLMLHLGPAILAQGTSWLWLLRNKGAKAMMKFLGGVGEEIVQESFATRGWGAWPAIKKATAQRKKSTAILIESAQMRKAVSSRVV